jgi:putative intracellular protease/amidase
MSFGDSAMIETFAIDNKISKTATTILMPLPDHDFDPTESAIPWKVCTSNGWIVEFSTEHGLVAQTDLNKLKGPLPGLLSANKKAQTAYQQMAEDQYFQHPTPYADINPDQYDALLLPGGDAPGVRQYLDNQVLRGKVLQFWQQDKLIGALCHGLLVLARTIVPQTARSVLYGRKVTAVPKSLDQLAYRIDRLVVKHGYVMYSSCVADEVSACLESPDDYLKGPGFLSPYVVSDGNLVTSRWYIDAEVFAERFADELQKRIEQQATPMREHK